MEENIDEEEAVRQKLKDLQIFVPFLDSLLDDFQKSRSSINRGVITKFHHLRSVITSGEKGRPKLPLLLKCEELLTNFQKSKLVKKVSSEAESSENEILKKTSMKSAANSSETMESTNKHHSSFRSADELRREIQSSSSSSDSRRDHGGFTQDDRSKKSYRQRSSDSQRSTDSCSEQSTIPRRRDSVEFVSPVKRTPQRRNSETSITIDDQPSSPEADIFIEREILASRRQQTTADLVVLTPRSPSPPPDSAETLPNTSPKLIPHEPVNNILSLPMPPSIEDDLHMESITCRPQDPRPRLSKAILKSREKLQQLTKKISIREKSQAALPSILSNAHSYTMLGQMSHHYKGPGTVKDYAHGTASPMESTCDAFAYSPELENIGTDDLDDVDDEHVENRVSPIPTSDRELPRQEFPNFNLPMPSVLNILSDDDLKSLATAVTTVNMAESNILPSTQRPVQPKSRSIPKVNDFIPARSVIHRVPSHQMASKGRSLEGTNVSKPSESISSRDPRKKAVSSSVGNLPVEASSSHSTSSIISNISGRPAETFLPAPVDKPVWGVSHKPPPPQQQQQQQPCNYLPFNSSSNLTRPPVGQQLNLSQIVTSDGQPIAPHNRFGSSFSHTPSQHTFLKHNISQQSQQQRYGNSIPHRKPGVALTYAEHKAMKAAEEQAKRKVEEERKLQEEATKAATQTDTLKNSTINLPKKTSTPFNIKLPSKKPLTQLIEAKPLPQYASVSATVKKKSDSKSKSADERVKTESKGKFDETIEDTKRKKDKKIKKSTSKEHHKIKASAEQHNSDSKKGDRKICKDRRSSSERREKHPERRLSADDTEKYVDKSLEKVSPLGSLYGEMPGPRIGKGYGPQIFKIPKKPKKPVSTTSQKDMETEQVIEDIEVEKEVDLNIQKKVEVREEEKSLILEIPVLTTSTTRISPSVLHQQDNTLTQEQVELFIRKSFESGEAKKLLDERTKIFPLLQKINDPKKLAKIRKLIESDSESEEENVAADTVVNTVRKEEEKTVLGKEDIVLNDDSDDEPLFLRMNSKQTVIGSDEDSNDTVAAPESEDSNDTIPAPEPMDIEEPEIIVDVAEVPKMTQVQHLEEKKQEPGNEEEKVSKQNAKPKSKRRNSLDMLHEDIREMFISEGVLAATGSRNVKPVTYTSSEVAKCRKIKKESYDSDVKRESLDNSFSEEMKEPANETQPVLDELPQVFVRLERISTSTTDYDSSRSITPSSDRGSYTSFRNVARRGKARRGPNKGNRKPPKKRATSKVTTLDQHEPIENESDQQEPHELDKTSDVTDTDIVQSEILERDNLSNSYENTSDISDTLALHESESRGIKVGYGKRGKGRRGRKSAWQKGVTNSRKPTAKKVSKYAEKTEIEIIDPRYHFSPNSVNICCLLCTYEGKKIVDHYLTHHPHSEVHISRISQEEFEHAQHQPPHLPPPAMVMTCRFCSKEELNIENLYDHMTEHTGEYRYKCPKCDTYIKSVKKTVLNHMIKSHPEISYPVPDELVDGPHVDSTYLTGFVCGFCRYTQLNKSSVEKHVEKWHRCEKGATCPPGVQEVNEINLAKWDQDIPDTNNSVLDCHRSDTDVLLPKSEMDDGDAQFVDTSVPLDLPTLNRYEDSSTTNSYDFSSVIKKEVQDVSASALGCTISTDAIVKTETNEQNTEADDPLANMDIQATISSLQELLREAPKNPKFLLENIRNKRYGSIDESAEEAESNVSPFLPESTASQFLPESTASQFLPESNVSQFLPESNVSQFLPSSVDNVSPDIEKDSPTVDSAVPSCSFHAATSTSTVTAGEEMSSEDEDMSFHMTVDNKQPNILKPDLIDKVRSLFAKTINQDSQLKNRIDIDPLGVEVSNPYSSLSSTPSTSTETSEASNLEAQNENDQIDSLLASMEVEPTPPLQKPDRKRKAINVFKCFACPLQGLDFNSLIRHMRSSHAPHTRGHCPECSFSFDYLDIAVQHYIKEHKPIEEPPTSVQCVMNTSEDTSALETNDLSKSIRVKPISQLLAGQIPPLSDGSQKLTGIVLKQEKGPFKTSTQEQDPLQVTMQQQNPLPTSVQEQDLAQTSSGSQLLRNNQTLDVRSLPQITSQNRSFIPFPAGSRMVLGPNKSAQNTIVQKNNGLQSTSNFMNQANKSNEVTSRPRPLKMAPAPIYAKTIKDKVVYETMLTPSKLRRKYKCLGTLCDFCTDNEKRFTHHFNVHQQFLKKIPQDPQNIGVAQDSECPSNEIKLPSWKQCAYCCKAFNSAEAIIDHIGKMHNNCVFQCAYCFYRSASKSNVTLHQTQNHPDRKPQILMCSDSEPPSEATLPAQTNLLGNLVMPYVCLQGNCNRQFYNRDIFLKHMTIEHGTCALFQCHMCCDNYISPLLLLDHYKMHSYHEYQCMICRHGTDTQEDMHRHLYVEHANYTACLLIRSMIGAKSERNVLQGALRRLEMANITVVHVPADPEDEKDPGDSDDENISVTSPYLSNITAFNISGPRKQTVLKDEAVAGTSTQDTADFRIRHDRFEDLDSIVTRSKSSTSLNGQDDDCQDSTEVELDGHKLYMCCNKGCGTSFETSEELSEHLMVCDMARASIALCCVHCTRTFRQVPGLIEHLRNMHGPKRFTCGICPDFRVSCLNNMHRHFKGRHKTVAVSLKPVDPFKNNQETDKFIVYQRQSSSPVKSAPKRVSKLNVFSPSEIEQLPKQPIFQTHVQCSECNFSDRVRSNVIRHLKSHIEDKKEITKAIPINPMPCLDSREKHFDKMTNWAGSSHRNPDGTIKSPPKRRSGIDLSIGDLEKLPRFIPSSRRYVCGAENCLYLTTDLDMLTLHVMNLHAEESVYTCPHCPNLEKIDGPGSLFENGLAHLKLHGDRLYRCSVCQYHHHTKKTVEQHVLEMHDDFPENVLIIREPDNPEPEPSVQNHTWLCSECGFTCHNCEEVKNHCKVEHNIKSQYRCSLCNVRSSAICTVEQHFLSKHPGEDTLMYASYYRSDLSDNKIIIRVPTVESKGEVVKPVPVQHSPIFAIPEKIKTIRQILVEEVESPLEKSTVALVQKEVKQKSNKGYSDNDLITKFGSFGKPVDLFYMCPLCLNYKNKMKHNFRDHLFREFQFKKYKCKECSVSTSNRASLQRHLHRIHNIQKDFLKHICNRKDNPQLQTWVTRVLTYQSSLMEKESVQNDAVLQQHPRLSSPKSCHVQTPPTSPKQNSSLLESHSKLHISSALRMSPRSLVKTQAVRQQEENRENSKDKPVVEATIRTTINLDMDEDEGPLVIEEHKDENEEQKEAEPSQMYASDLLQTTDDMQKKCSKKGKGQYSCRHCSRTFKQAHGLKMHIKLFHFRIAAYKCAHCPVSMNSKLLILQHCRYAHPSLPEAVVRKADQKIKLDDAFWEREYGIKRGEHAPEPSTPPVTDNPGIYKKKCQYCDYRTKLSATLKRHEMRHWVQKPFRCGYCEFESVVETNIKKHCEKVHIGQLVKIIENVMPSQPDIKPVKRSKSANFASDVKEDKKTIEMKRILEPSSDIKNVHEPGVEIKNDGEFGVKLKIDHERGMEVNEDCELGMDVKEDHESDIEVLRLIDKPSSEFNNLNSNIHETKNKNSVTVLEKPSFLHRCFYCPLKAVKLQDIHQHWLVKHKNNILNPLPFRYKSIPISDVLQGKEMGSSKVAQYSCAYCSFKGVINTLKSHCTRWHPGKNFKIVNFNRSSFKCTYCNYLSFEILPLQQHIKTKHPDLSFAYEIVNSEEKIKKTSETFICLWCQDTCETKEKMEFHNTCFHSHLEPKFKIVAPSDDDVDLLAPLKVSVETCIKSETPSKSVRILNPNRRLFLCPDCPKKTITIRVMRTHVSIMHVKEFECPHCGIILADNTAAHMHMVVEHPELDSTKITIPKARQMVDNKMLFVTREGDEEKNNTSIPEITEVSVTDILNQQQTLNVFSPSSSTKFTSSTIVSDTSNSVLQLVSKSLTSDKCSTLQPPVKKVRCVAKKSTAKLSKNTARKSFPQRFCTPHDVSCIQPSDSDDDSESEVEDGHSVYIHPSQREPLPSLSSMTQIVTQLSVGPFNTIRVTADKLALLMDLEPKISITDCSKSHRML